MQENEVQISIPGLQTAPPLVLPPNPLPQESPRQPKAKVSWLGLSIFGLAAWLILGGGLESLIKTSSTIQTGATRTAQTITSLQTPSGVPAAVGATAAPATMRIVIPTQRPAVVVVPRSGAPDPPAATEVPTAVPSPTAQPTPADCILTTWPDGSQSCNDGRQIDAVHSQPGYCRVVLVGPAGGHCANGAPAGNVILPDPEVAAEPTNTPWPAEPTKGFFWSWTQSIPDAKGAHSCVYATFADGHQQQTCTEDGRIIQQHDAEFVARMLEDGRIAPGVGIPHG